MFSTEGELQTPHQLNRFFNAGWKKGTNIRAMKKHMTVRLDHLQIQMKVRMHKRQVGLLMPAARHALNAFPCTSPCQNCSKSDHPASSTGFFQGCAWKSKLNNSDRCMHCYTTTKLWVWVLHFRCDLENTTCYFAITGGNSNTVCSSIQHYSHLPQTHQLFSSLFPFKASAHAVASKQKLVRTWHGIDMQRHIKRTLVCFLPTGCTDAHQRECQWRWRRLAGQRQSHVPEAPEGHLSAHRCTLRLNA